VDQTETVDPDSGLKDAGYPDAAIPANEEFNWLYWKYYGFLTWLVGTVLRTFDWMAEAVPLISEEFAFRTHNTLSGSGALSSIGDIGQTSTAALTPGKVITDSEQIYYYNGQQVAALPGLGVAGTEIWTVNPGTATIVDITTDGLYVYATTAANTYLLNRDTGATVATIPVRSTLANGKLVANGETLAIFQSKTGQLDIALYQSLGATPSLLGVYGVNLLGGSFSGLSLALDHDTVYYTAQGAVGGERIGAVSILATPVLRWGAADESLEPEVVVADGQWIYVGGDGSSNTWDEFNLISFRRTDGSMVWRAMRGATGTVVETLAIDDLYLWGSDDSDVPFAVDAESGQDLWVGSATNIITDSDGYRALAHTGGATINGYDGGSPERAWYRPAATDPKRTPGHKLVIPHTSRHHTAARPRPYGEGTHYYEDTSTYTTTSSSPVSALGGAQSFSVPDAGRYRVDWVCRWNHSVTSAVIWLTPQIDGAGLHPTGFADQPKVGSATPIDGGWREVTLAAGAHTLDFLVNVASGSGTLSIYWVNFHIRRIY
jgi:hypothetical protein